MLDIIIEDKDLYLCRLFEDTLDKKEKEYDSFKKNSFYEGLVFGLCLIGVIVLLFYSNASISNKLIFGIFILLLYLGLLGCYFYKRISLKKDLIRMREFKTYDDYFKYILNENNRKSSIDCDAFNNYNRFQNFLVLESSVILKFWTDGIIDVLIDYKDGDYVETMSFKVIIRDYLGSTNRLVFSDKGTIYLDKIYSNKQVRR